MPGLHLLALSKSSAADCEVERFTESVSKLRHYPGYTSSVCSLDERLALGFSGYRGYPYTHFRKADRDVVVEGNIYNLSTQEIQSRLSELVLTGAESIESVREFVLQAEGEFIVAVYDRTDRVLLVFNDSLGRLPVYYHASALGLVVSKEIKLVLPHMASVRFGRGALAEYLLFRYPLGDRTLIEDVHRMPPGAMLAYDFASDATSVTQSASWNLDADPAAPDTVEGAAANLVAPFLDACTRMSAFSAGKTMVVSLSGGYDSRTTLAGFAKVGARPTAFTFSNDKYRTELPAAREVARLLNIEHRIIPVLDVTGYGVEHKRWLAYLLDGMNSVNHFGALEFARIVSRQFAGDVIEFSGEGGDKALPPLGFNPRSRSIEQLAEAIYATDRRFSLSEVSRLLGVDRDELWCRFVGHLASYPERTLEGKFKHFKVFERGFKWLFEGESRDRYIHWHATPFYSQHFFAEAMRIPESLKRGRALYRRFLSEINPGCAQVRYDKPWMARLLARMSVLLPVPLISFLSKHLKKEKLADKARGNSGLADFRQALERVLDRSTIVREYFDVPYTRRIMMQETSQEKLMVLGTILLYMDVVETGVCCSVDTVQCASASPDSGTKTDSA